MFQEASGNAPALLCLEDIEAAFGNAVPERTERLRREIFIQMDNKNRDGINVVFIIYMPISKDQQHVKMF